jgi:hypothetical protein
MPLTFDRERHEYRLDGRLVPSVTQVLAPCYDFANIPAEVLARKRALGQAVHRAIEFDLEGDLDESTIAAEIAPYVEAWRRFRADREYQPLLSEHRVVHAKFGYAGTLDLFGTTLREVKPRKFKRVHALIDIKNTFVVARAVGLQTVAYREALKASHGGPGVADAHRMALQLRPDATYDEHWFDSPKDFPVFLNFLATHNWLATTAKETT